MKSAKTKASTGKGSVTSQECEPKAKHDWQAEIIQSIIEVTFCHFSDEMTEGLKNEF